MSHRNDHNKNNKKADTQNNSTQKQDESQMQHMAHDLRDKAQYAGEEMRKYMTSAVGDLDSFKSDLEKSIRKEPLKATMIAVAAGFIVGLIVRH